MKYVRAPLVLYAALVSLVGIYGDGDNLERTPEEIRVIDYLADFFQSEYRILEDRLRIDGKDFVVAVRDYREFSNLVDKVVIYEELNTGFFVHLRIDGPMIYDSANTKIVNLHQIPDSTAYELFYKKPKGAIESYGIGLHPYLFYGTSPADPPLSILWDKDNDVFYEYVFDMNTLE